VVNSEESPQLMICRDASQDAVNKQYIVTMSRRENDEKVAVNRRVVGSSYLRSHQFL
jgi:hypothetical protein